MTATRPGTLGTGAVTLQNGTALSIGGLPGATISGFNGNGAGWNLQGTGGAPTVSGDVLTITTAAGSLARTAWFNTPYNIPTIGANQTTPDFSALKARLTEEIRVEALHALPAAGMPDG